MQIISTNTARPKTFLWNGKEVTTGIYKKPTEFPIYLGKHNVKGDEVSDRKVHGGIFKACYLFSAEHYPYWKEYYPNLDWSFGMFGENLTVTGLDETKLYIGDIFKIGKALVQITQPREPCFKFAHKFENDSILQQFIDHGYPGTYVKVLEEGEVKMGDQLVLKEQTKNSISIYDFFKLLNAKNKNQIHLKLILNNHDVSERMRKRPKVNLV